MNKIPKVSRDWHTFKLNVPFDATPPAAAVSELACEIIHDYYHRGSLYDTDTRIGLERSGRSTVRSSQNSDGSGRTCQVTPLLFG